MNLPLLAGNKSASLDPMRDSFAHAALTGMLARADLSAGKPAAATLAYAYADAMIAERFKMQPQPPALTHLNPIAALSPQETPTFTPQENNQPHPQNNQPLP